MKKVQIDYTLFGSVTIDVPDDFIVDDGSVEELIRQQSDKDLIAGIERNGIEIDGDAIELKEYNEMRPGEDYDV